MDLFVHIFKRHFGFLHAFTLRIDIHAFKTET